MESPEGAPQSVQQREATITAPTPVEPSKAEKGPGPLKKIWMTIRGQNHQSPGEIHADLADKKMGENDSGSLSAENGTPQVDSSSVNPTPTEATGTTAQNPELAPIEAAPAAAAQVNPSVGGVDAMITQLQEKEKDDTETPTSEPAPAAVVTDIEGSSSTAQATTEDTGAALDAMAARLTTIPEGANSNTDAQSGEADTSIKDTANSGAIDTSTSMPPTTITPSPAIQQPANPTPIAETPVGLKSAENAVVDSDTTPPPPAPAPSNIVDFQSATARTQEGVSAAPAQQPEVTPAVSPAGPAQLKQAA